MEELAKASGVSTIWISSPNSLQSTPILRDGTEEQKEQYLRPMGTGEKLFAFGLTRISKALLYLGLNVLLLVFLFFVRICFNKLSCNIAYKIQFSLIRHMQNFKMQYFDSSYAGDLVSRFTTDTNTIKELYQTLLNDLLGFMLNLAMMLTVMFYISPYLLFP